MQNGPYTLLELLLFDYYLFTMGPACAESNAAVPSTSARAAAMIYFFIGFSLKMKDVEYKSLNNLYPLYLSYKT